MKLIERVPPPIAITLPLVLGAIVGVSYPRFEPSRDCMTDPCRVRRAEGAAVAEALAAKAAKSGSLSAFDSKDLPEWADSRAELVSFAGSHKADVLEKVYQRYYRYRVPDEVAGRKWSEISGDEVVLETSGFGRWDVEVLKSGEARYRDTPL